MRENKESGLSSGMQKMLVQDEATVARLAEAGSGDSDDEYPHSFAQLSHQLSKRKSENPFFPEGSEDSRFVHNNGARNKLSPSPPTSCCSIM